MSKKSRVILFLIILITVPIIWQQVSAKKAKTMQEAAQKMPKQVQKHQNIISKVTDHRSP